MQSWINAPHLDPGQMAVCRERFRAHPAGLLVVDNVLRDDAARQIGEFLLRDAEYDQAYGLYSGETADGDVARRDHDAAVGEPAWRSAQEEDRFYRFGVIRGARAGVMSPGLLTYLKFRSACDEPAFQAFFEDLTGLRLGTAVSYVHRMVRGDYLKVHADHFEDRRLAFVLYLTPGWRPAFGGGFQILDAAGVPTRIEAAFNRLLLFDVKSGARHFVEPILPEAGDHARVSIGGWILDPAQAEGL